MADFFASFGDVQAVVNDGFQYAISRRGDTLSSIRQLVTFFMHDIPSDSFLSSLRSNRLDAWLVQALGSAALLSKVTGSPLRSAKNLLKDGVLGEVAGQQADEADEDFLNALRRLAVHEVVDGRFSSLFSHNCTYNSKTIRTFAHEIRINEYRKGQTYDNNDCTDSHRAGGLVRADASLDGLGVPQGGDIRPRFREAPRV